MLPNETLRQGLDLCLTETNLTDILGILQRGKVRDCYTRRGLRYIVSTDRVSAFDVVLGTVPFKGQVLNQLAAYWLKKTKDLAPNHLIYTPDPSVSIVKECTPLSTEFVMRGYLTGSSNTSILVSYQKGNRTFCGHVLLDGMTPHQKLPDVLLTPTTKAPHGEHDENLSREELIAAGHISESDFDAAAGLAHQLFKYGQDEAVSRGLILVDTKYELGYTEDGALVFIDEIHTPDSSRYWMSDTYESDLSEGRSPHGLSKEYIREWLVEQGYRGEGPPPTLPDEVRMEAARRYIDTYELLTGTTFVPNLEPPEERIRNCFQQIRL